VRLVIDGFDSAVYTVLLFEQFEKIVFIVQWHTKDKKFENTRLSSSVPSNTSARAYTEIRSDADYKRISLKS
jgi:hypothetical protein